MTLKNTRAQNYSEWYQEVVTAADMAELSPSPGCMTMKPWGHDLWENIRNAFDAEFKRTDHENYSYPLLIPLSFFAKEAEHVDGFAKEMAVVTHSKLIKNGRKLIPTGKLEEPLILRPTSETIIAEAFSRWVKSYRDLPILTNQWCNIVRWEMRPRMFLRTREFFWQEGHTVHASAEEAKAETMTILDVYKNVIESYLAFPVIAGRKPPHERFPGAADTYTVEAMMQDGRAVQAGTSHFLGQTFARSADIKFQNKQGQLEYAYTTSWGVSTRLIGCIIMTHGDDEGLKTPPRIAPHQVVFVPILRDGADKDKIMAYIDELKGKLEERTAFKMPIRVKTDKRDKASIDKVWDWTRKGAPLVCEIGMRDVKNRTVVTRVRNRYGKDGYKLDLPADKFAGEAPGMLEAMQKEMFDAAKAYRDANMVRAESREEFARIFEKKNAYLETDGPAFMLAPWSGDEETLDWLKERRITVRCIPLEGGEVKAGTKCILTGKQAEFNTLFARAY